MDDIPFFDTSSFETRGGIFAEAFKPNPTVSVKTATNSINHDAGSSDMSDTDSSKVLNDSLLMASLSDSDGGSSLGQAEMSNSMRRRKTSWFGLKDSNGETTQVDIVPGHKRGKSLDHSFPLTNDVRVVVSDEDPATATELKESEVQSQQQQPQRRAQSHNSRVVVETSPEPLTPSFNPIDSSSGLSRSAPSSSPISLSIPSTPQPSVNSSSGSLFATIRSRGAVMAEKPKEAMKKWGVNVNWGTGLRKGDKEPDKFREKVKDDWGLDTDHGELWGERKDPTTSRTSFAELRRKVEAREKERAQALTSTFTDDDGEHGEQPRVTRSSGTKPIDIPGVPQLQAGIPSTIAPDVSHRPPTSNGTTPFLSPSAPRTTTELHTHTHATTPPKEPERQRRLSSATSDGPPVVEAAPVIPIRAQPRAATMVIPSIHVSHRNDVMALSSAPALPPQSKAGEPAAPLPAPTLGGIQTVRRLFRGNHLDLKDHEERKTTSTSSSEVILTPPPLPPRKQSAELDRVRQSPSPIPKTVSPPDSPASHALKQVVEQDTSRKPPPLPARRDTPTIATRISSSNSASQSTPDIIAASSIGIGFNPPQVESPIHDHHESHPLSTDSFPRSSEKPPLPPRRPTFPISIDKMD